MLKCITIKFKDPEDTVTKNFQRGGKNRIYSKNKESEQLRIAKGGGGRRQRSNAFKILKNNISNLKIAT